MPPAWLQQTRPGGTILTDLRGGFAGNLALFTVDADKSAHSRFLAETVRFIPLRSPEQPFQLLPELSARAVSTPGEHRTTSLDPSMLRDHTFAFFAVSAAIAAVPTVALAPIQEMVLGTSLASSSRQHGGAWLLKLVQLSLPGSRLSAGRLNPRGFAGHLRVLRRVGEIT